MSFEEKSVLVIFFLTSFMWIFRSNINLGAFTIPGWSNVLGAAKLVDDSTVAITMALILFLIPCRSEESKFKFILNQNDIKKVPWDIVLLFGGGFALAAGFVESDLSKLIGHKFMVLKDVSPIILIITILGIVVFTSELTSNTAQTAIVLPLLASLAIELNLDPITIMIPATFSVSLAFMFPVGTPPNAIVFGSGRLKVWDMVKAGFILNLLGIVLVAILAQLFFL